MLDIKFIRENKELVQKAARDKRVDVDIDQLLMFDSKRRELKGEEDEINRLRKIQSKEIFEQMKISNSNNPSLVNLKHGDLKEKENKLKAELKTVEDEYHEVMYQIPAIPAKDVEVSPDLETKDAQILRKVGEPTQFDFEPKDHLDLGEALDIIDTKRAVRMSGSRFAYLKGDAVLLELALIQFAMNELTKKGFIPVVPPALIRKSITEKLGYWQAGGSKDYYLVMDEEEQNELYLVGTAEHSIVPMHEEEVMIKKDLPKRYLGFSPAFRREAGTYGKDTRGILRMHQFDKVEMVSFTTQEDDDKEHELLLSVEEKLFQSLGIPYQIVKSYAHDLGFPVARKYDIEAWMPGQSAYREVTSTSTTGDFQARRFNIKYQDGDEKKYAHILNGTAFAIGRTIIAIMENYQQTDGSINIPEVLLPYMHGVEIIEHRT